MGEQLLPSSLWTWAGRDAQPLTHPLILLRGRPKWGQKKKRHVGGTRRVHTKTLQSRRGPQEKWWSSLTRGLTASRQETFIQAATGRFLWGRLFQTQLLHSARHNAEKIGVHAWARCAGLSRVRGGGIFVWANYAKINTVFLSMAPLTLLCWMNEMNKWIKILTFWTQPSV